MAQKSNKYFLVNALICTTLAVIFGGLLYFVVIKTGVLNPFKKAFQDFSLTDVYYSKFYNSKDIDQDIILINIKHSNRFEIAQALNKIVASKPKVVGLDVIFKDKKDKI